MGVREYLSSLDDDVAQAVFKSIEVAVELSDDQELDPSLAVSLNLEISRLVHIGIQEDLDAIFLFRDYGNGTVLPIMLVGGDVLEAAAMRDFMARFAESIGSTYSTYVKELSVAYATGLSSAQDSDLVHQNMAIFLRSSNESFRAFRKARRSIIAAIGDASDALGFDGDEFDGDEHDCETCSMNNVCPASTIKNLPGATAVKKKSRRATRPDVTPVPVQTQEFDLAKWSPNVQSS